MIFVGSYVLEGILLLMWLLVGSYVVEGVSPFNVDEARVDILAWIV